MTRRRLFIALLALVLASTVTRAFQSSPDLSGNWDGKFISKKEGAAPVEESAFSVLKQRGPELTGSVGPRPDRQQDIESGKVETAAGATTVTFQTGREGHRIYFALKLEGAALKGTAKDEFYGTTFAVELNRVK